jgi:cytochrome c556
MRGHHLLRATTLGLGLAGAAAIGAVWAQAPTNAADAIAARQKLMKEQGAAMKTISDSLKAGQVEPVPSAAEKLVSTAQQIPTLFPQGSIDPNTSRAKPEIWQQWSEFEGNAKRLESKAAQLAMTAKGGDVQATATAARDLGRTTCAACHDTFRGPEIKK